MPSKKNKVSGEVNNKEKNSEDVEKAIKMQLKNHEAVVEEAADEINAKAERAPMMIDTNILQCFKGLTHCEENIRLEATAQLMQQLKRTIRKGEVRLRSFS